MERTRHKNFVPSIDRWGAWAVKLRFIGVPVFTLCLVGGFLLSNRCPYVYGYSQIETARQNEAQIAQQRINETFGPQNVMALHVPKGTMTVKRHCWSGWRPTSRWTLPWGLPILRRWTAIP